MTHDTCYVALPFDRCNDGCLVPKVQKPCASAAEAVREAEMLSRSYVGAVAFSREIDIQAGTASNFLILGINGEVPDMNFLGAD